MRIEVGNCHSRLIDPPAPLLKRISDAFTHPIQSQGYAFAAHVIKSHADVPARKIAKIRMGFLSDVIEHETFNGEEKDLLATLDALELIEAANCKHPWDDIEQAPLLEDETRVIPEDHDVYKLYYECKMADGFARRAKRNKDFQKVRESAADHYKSCSKCHWRWEESIFKGVDFPTGILHLVVPMLEDVEIIDNREIPAGTPFDIGITLRPYQEEAVMSALDPFEETPHRGIIEIATGGGKTEVALSIAARLGVNTLIIVPTTAIFNEFTERWAKYTDKPLGTIAKGKVDLRQVTVAIFSDSWVKSDVGKELARRIDCLIIDEHHKISARIWYKYVMSVNAYYRFGQTATAFRETDLEDLKLQATTGPKLAEITTKQLQDTGWLSKCKVRMSPVKCEPVGRSGPEKYRTGIVLNDDRNNLIAWKVLNHLADGKKVLVIVAWGEHADELREYLPHFVYFIGGDSAAEIQAKKLRFLGDENLAVGTPTVDLGFDVPSIDVLVLAAAGKAEGRTQQRLGRLLRKSKSGGDGIMEDFVDLDGGNFEKQSKARIRTYKKLGQPVIMEGESDGR